MDFNRYFGFIGAKVRKTSEIRKLSISYFMCFGTLFAAFSSEENN